jgi:hypothetical protein
VEEGQGNGKRDVDHAEQSMFAGIALIAFSLAFVLSASFLSAQSAAPRLHTIFPPGGKVGATVTVSLSGEKLDDIAALQFSHRDITSEKVSNSFKVTIPKNVPPGTYDVRAVSKNGISNPRAFAVGVLSEIAESKNSSDSPQSVSLQNTINGRVEANTIDYFRFEAKQGQRVLARCEARGIDSKLEPVLTLYDSAGREVSRSRMGGLLDYTAAMGGEFTLRLHDQTYRGGAEYFYRLSIGTFPHIDYMLPISSGAKTKFAVFGRNLPGGKAADEKRTPRLERIEVELSENDPSVSKPLAGTPAQMAVDLFGYRVRNEGGVSEPVLFRFPSAPVVSEQEPNNMAATAQNITPPCEVTGTFGSGDRDWFRFAAKKGDVYWLEVVSHRLGEPTDPLLVVQRATTNGATDVLELNDSEANFGGTEFNTADRDPAGRFEAKEDGTYLIELRDLFSHSPHAAPAVYQVSIRKPAPDFRLAALPVSPLPAKKDAKDVGINSVSLRRGETMPVKVFAFRRDGFAGEIALKAEEADDVHASPTRIESGKNSALLFISAMDQVTVSNATLTVRGTATINGTEVDHAAAPVTVIWGSADPAAEPVISRLAAESPIAFSDADVPVRVHPLSNVINSITGRTVKVNFVVERRESFAGGLKLKPFGLAALDSLAELDVDAKATNLTLQIDLKEKKIPAGTHVFALQVSPQPKPQPDKSKKPKDPPPAFYSEPVVLQVVSGAAAQSNPPAK